MTKVIGYEPVSKQNYPEKEISKLIDKEIIIKLFDFQKLPLRNYKVEDMCPS